MMMTMMTMMMMMMMMMPEFYQNIIKAWIEIGGSQKPYPINNIDILKQPI